MRNYAVHYGDGHLSKCHTLGDDFDSLEEAEEAAKPLIDQYQIVIIADTDGNEWILRLENCNG